MLENPTNTSRRDGRPRRSLWKTPALITVLALTAALMGNRFVDGWNWPVRGFILLGTLVFSTGVTYQLVTRNVDAMVYRAALGGTLAAALVLAWANFVQAADDVNPAAIMYLCVPVVGIIGAAIARFRPDGMARALLITALAQALVFTIALVRNPPVASWSAAVWRGFGMNACCFVVFLASALVLRKPGRDWSAEGLA